MTSQSDSSPTAQDLWRDDPERWLSSHDSGVLSLSVGPTGNLATFRLAPQWYRTLSVAEFGDAVLRAKRESNGLRVRELEEPQGAPNGGSPTHDPAGALARNFNDSKKEAEDLSRNMANLHGFPTARGRARQSTEMSRGVTTKRSFLPRTLIGGAALLLMTGCSNPDVPSPPSVSEVQLEAFVGTFFEYLEENEPGAALRMTNLVHSTPRVDDALLDGHLYALNEAPLKLLEATTRWVRPPLALVDVTYTMGGKELHDAVLVHEITRLAGEPVAAAGGLRIELSDGAFGIDVDGVQYLPSDTTYSIFGTDVTEAITAVGQNPDLTANQRFTLPAFGGTYVLEIDVPGEAGFTESVTIDTTSFHGVSREPGKIVKIAEQHGFTDVLWGG